MTRQGIQQYFHNKAQAVRIAKERGRPLISIYAGQMYFVPAPGYRFNPKTFLTDQRKVARYLGKPMPRVLKVR